MSDPTTFDAIVVGSGITGGWAAKELTEKGLKTLVLEAGRNIVPEEDYVEHVPEWEMKFRGMGDRRKLADEQPIQSTCYACDEWSSKFFIKDSEHPYTTDPGKPFRWIRGRQVGGRSITWGRQSYRWSDLDFEANFRDGTATDWPIRSASAGGYSRRNAWVSRRAWHSARAEKALAELGVDTERKDPARA